MFPGPGELEKLLLTGVAMITKQAEESLRNIASDASDSIGKTANKAVEILQIIKRKIDDAVSEFNQQNEKFKQTATELDALVKIHIGKYKELTDKSEELIKKLESINFPERLDKIDAQVAAINQGVQNVQMKIENLERSIKDEIQSKHAFLKVHLEKQDAEMKWLKWLVIIGILAASLTPIIAKHFL